MKSFPPYLICDKTAVIIVKTVVDELGALSDRLQIENNKNGQKHGHKLENERKNVKNGR